LENRPEHERAQDQGDRDPFGGFSQERGGDQYPAAAGEKGWFAVDPKDYEAFDMRKPVMKIPFPEARLYEMTQELYSSFFTPQYFARKILSIRKWDDVKFYIMSAKRLLGHLLDFDKNQTKVSMLSPKFWTDASKSMIKHLKG